MMYKHSSCKTDRADAAVIKDTSVLAISRKANAGNCGIVSAEGKRTITLVSGKHGYRDHEEIPKSSNGSDRKAKSRQRQKRYTQQNRSQACRMQAKAGVCSNPRNAVNAVTNLQCLAPRQNKIVGDDISHYLDRVRCHESLRQITRL